MILAEARTNNSNESMRNVIKISRNCTYAIRLTAIPLVLLLIVSVVQSVELAHAQNTTSNATVGNAAKTTISSAGNKTIIITPSIPAKSTSPAYNRTGFNNLYVLTINGKTFPIKYSITGGKVVGLLADKDRTTLVLVLDPSAKGGNMTIELPRHVMDSKGASNADTKYQIKIDGKGVDYKEVANNADARILSIDFSKDNRLVEIIGTQLTQ
ncbi:MAG: hypothetical protein WA323_13880 [Candidatus Nitrosopolaris sp.]|jgi:hypothetical protein